MAAGVTTVASASAGRGRAILPRAHADRCTRTPSVPPAFGGACTRAQAGGCAPARATRSPQPRNADVGVERQRHVSFPCLCTQTQSLRGGLRVLLIRAHAGARMGDRARADVADDALPGYLKGPGRALAPRLGEKADSGDPEPIRGTGPRPSKTWMSPKYSVRGGDVRKHFWVCAVGQLYKGRHGVDEGCVTPRSWPGSASWSSDLDEHGRRRRGLLSWGGSPGWRADAA